MEAAVSDTPSGDVYDMIARLAVSRLLDEGLAEAQALAEAAFDSAWPPGPSAYRDSLAADIASAFATAVPTLRQAAIDGFRVAPKEAVRRATAAAMYLAFRCAMSVEVAEVRHRGEKVLAEGESAGSHWLKKWVCRKGPDGKPDHRVCDWCRWQDAQPAIELGQEFPSGPSVGGRTPPRVYHDLRCPPRHPRCRCRIILVRVGSRGLVRPKHDPEPALFISAADIRAMPAGRYHALTDFHRAALHELGQVIMKHRQAGRA